MEDQSPYLKGYKIDIRVADDSAYEGRPEAAEFDWDGIAEQYFETLDDYNAVYGRADRKTRADTQANTKAFQRFVVTEHILR